MSTPEIKRQTAIDNGFYAEDFSPRKCFKCGSLSVLQVPTDSVGYIITEYSLRCAKCGTELGYWSAGSYDPDFCESCGEELLEKGYEEDTKTNR